MPDDVVSDFLRGLAKKLGLGPLCQSEIERELASHLEDSVEGHQATGLTPEEARKRAVEDFGAPEDIARRLRWVHGFGRFSERRFRDAVLGGVPFFLAWLQMAIFRLYGTDYLALVLWPLFIGVSIWALKEAVPAWSVTWLGFANVIVMQIAFLGATWVSSVSWMGPVSALVLLVFSSHLMARKHAALALLFLLPLSFPYVYLGYEQAVMSHRILVETTVLLLGSAFSFAHLLTRGRNPRPFVLLGLAFYTIVYADMMSRGGPPFGASGLRLIALRALLYILPLVLVSSSAFLSLTLKKRT